MKEIIKRVPKRMRVDDGYKGHKLRDAKVFRNRQKRGVIEAIRRDLKRRVAIEPIIGHAKNDGLLWRNYRKGRGDERNSILSAIGFNFRPWITVLPAEL